MYLYRPDKSFTIINISIFMEACVWSFFIVASTAFVLLVLGVRADTGGYLYFKFLCYENPGHKVANGDACDSVPGIECDPYFSICIENCQTYYSQTESYDNAGSVCNKNSDNRGVLRYPIKKTLAYPLSNTCYVKITASETDGWTRYEPLMASFSAEFRQTHASNLTTSIFKEISMYRNEFRYANPAARLTIAMALQCERNLFGDHCLTRCTETLFYSCSKNGKKICKEGWAGESCVVKDLCLYQLCAKGSKCLIIEKRARWCALPDTQ